MSWLAKSFANLIVADEEDDERDGDDRGEEDGNGTTTSPTEELDLSGSTSANLGKGVKEDLSELSKTLTRQFWGVASFLAPPPTPNNSEIDSDLQPPTVSPNSENPEEIGGIRSDFAEIGGRFRSGISKLSSAKAVSEISKIASSFLQFDSDGEEEEINKVESGGVDVIGVTEEVLTFAQNISMHPETWLDFPLFYDDEAADDFDMSDVQQEHALAVEHLVPRLSALRIELCPGHISEGNFWKIYFVLLHPRLNKHDAELLSTPQIVEARALLLQDLQSRTKSSLDDWSSSMKKEGKPLEEDKFSVDIETVKHPVTTTDLGVVDKAVIEEDISAYPRKDASPDTAISTAKVPEKVEDNGDEWLEDESSTVVGSEKISAMTIAEDEDVSFSDLEEDDEKLQGSGATRSAPASSSTGKPVSGKLSDEAANDWSDLDDLDVE